MVFDEDFSTGLKQFSGTARLFPLPNLVLFPHVMQPLHIFEPRYCDLLKDAMADDRLIAMATLRPGWEGDYEGRPPIWPFACLGRVTVHHRLPEGSYNVLLTGLARIRLVRELPPAQSYRKAEVELCEDVCPAQAAGQVADLRGKLRAAFLDILPHLPQAQEQLDQLIGSNLSLGVLADIASYMIDLELAEKQSLLAETNVIRRAKRLLGHLAAASAQCDPGSCGVSPFPPAFSPN